MRCPFSKLGEPGEVNDQPGLATPLRHEESGADPFIVAIGVGAFDDAGVEQVLQQLIRIFLKMEGSFLHFVPAEWLVLRVVAVDVDLHRQDLQRVELFCVENIGELVCNLVESVKVSVVDGSCRVVVVRRCRKSSETTRNLLRSL